MLGVAPLIIDVFDPMMNEEFDIFDDDKWDNDASIINGHVLNLWFDGNDNYSCFMTLNHMIIIIL